MFATRCAACHGTEGAGGELGPSIVARIPLRNDQDLEAVIKEGLPGAGMPSFPSLSASETTNLIAFLRTLRPRAGGPQRTNVGLADGRTLAGVVLNQSSGEMQLLGDDRKVHLLRESGDKYHQVTSQTDWPTYNGHPNGNRYSTLAQITTANVSRARPEVDLHAAQRRAAAGDAGRRGRRDVRHARQRLLRARRRQRAARSGTTGGRARAGWRVSRRAASIAAWRSPAIACSWPPITRTSSPLNRATGALLWETEMADWHQNYNAHRRADGRRQPGDLRHRRRR